MIRIGDYVRIRGFGPNEMVGKVAHKQPGAVWIQFRDDSHCWWLHKMRDLRPAKPAEVERSLRRDAKLRALQAQWAAERSK